MQLMQRLTDKLSLAEVTRLTRGPFTWRGQHFTTVFIVARWSWVAMVSPLSWLVVVAFDK